MPRGWPGNDHTEHTFAMVLPYSANCDKLALLYALKSEPVMSVPKMAVLITSVALMSSAGYAATQKPQFGTQVDCLSDAVGNCAGLEPQLDPEPVPVTAQLGTASGYMPKFESFLFPAFVADPTGFGAISQNVIQMGQATRAAFQVGAQSVRNSNFTGFAAVQALMARLLDEHENPEPLVLGSLLGGSPGQGEVAAFPTLADQLQFSGPLGQASSQGGSSVSDAGVAATGRNGAASDASGASAASSVGSASLSGGSGSGGTPVEIAEDEVLVATQTSESVTEENPLADILPSALGEAEVIDTSSTGTSTQPEADLPQVADVSPASNDPTVPQTFAGAASVPAVPLPLGWILLSSTLVLLLRFRKQA